jgi:hypothetical protein
VAASLEDKGFELITLGATEAEWLAALGTLGRALGKSEGDA